jgi:drug/metabolite transporter (DMT)-like permease
LSQKHPTLGVLFAVSAAILFGVNASTTKVIIESGISPEQVVFVRSLFAFIISLSWALVANRGQLKVPRRYIPALILLGIVGVGMLQWTYSLAVLLLPVGIALLIEYTAVLWVPLIALIFFKEKVKRQIWLGAALVLGGLAVVGQVWDSQLDPIGVFFAFAAAASLTTYFITGERIQRHLPTNVVMTYGMGVSTLIFFFSADLGNFNFAGLAEPLDLSGNLAGTAVPLWLMMIWLGIFGSFAPMALSYLALRHLSATVVGVVATAETVMAALFALLWLGELITTTQALGSMVVIAGILLAQTARKAKVAKVVD